MSAEEVEGLVLAHALVRSALIQVLFDLSINGGLAKSTYVMVLGSVDLEAMVQGAGLRARYR